LCIIVGWQKCWLSDFALKQREIVGVMPKK